MSSCIHCTMRMKRKEATVTYHVNTHSVDKSVALRNLFIIVGGERTMQGMKYLQQNWGQ